MSLNKERKGKGVAETGNNGYGFGMVTQAPQAQVSTSEATANWVASTSAMNMRPVFGVNSMETTPSPAVETDDSFGYGLTPMQERLHQFESDPQVC